MTQWTRERRGGKSKKQSFVTLEPQKALEIGHVGISEGTVEAKAASPTIDFKSG